MIHTALWLAPSPLSLPLSLPGWPEFLKISPLEDRVVAMIWKFSDFLACFQNRPCTTPYRMLTKILMMMMVKTSKTQLSVTNIHVSCVQKWLAQTYSKDTRKLHLAFWLPSFTEKSLLAERLEFLRIVSWEICSLCRILKCYFIISSLSVFPHQIFSRILLNCVSPRSCTLSRSAAVFSPTNCAQNVQHSTPRWRWRLFIWSCCW